MSRFSELPKAYDASLVEDTIYAAWETSGVFNPDQLPGDRSEAYSIMMPPPNVTGVLHLGHVLENALMDTMARFQRMRGKKVLIVPGTDHAALPTQAKVEKLLMQQGMKYPRQELGREGLVEKIREYAEQSKTTILSQIKKLGTSCDWSRLAFTFDEERSQAVNEMFRRLYEDGLIYRGSRVVNWSVAGQSTCSDDEVVHVERPSKLYTFTYSHDFPITISSTRPETKLGDTAVAVHPSDERYQAYIGKVFSVDVGAEKPLEIKIISDEGVDKDFGTGALGVTPAHSPIDFEMYEKQKAKGDPINLISVIGSDGKMTQAAGSAYAGLTTEEAREKFVTWLRDKGLLEKEEDIVQSVGTSERFGDVIEAIPMLQWWLDMNKQIPSRGKSLKELMREAGEKISITPERFTKLYLQRVNNLRDWCLSRQIWWGHRIPVWYRIGGPSTSSGNNYSLSEAERNRRASNEDMVVSATSPGPDWVQDEDTLDTWFSSGLWTFSTLGWPNPSADFSTFHPTSWIQMGYEILYLWMMRMILMSSYALDQVPFHEVYIHGMLRDESGKKFSKSSGNTIDPVDIIQTYGCDALRWSVLIGTAPGNDSRFYEEKIEGAKNLVNKIWNISKFMLLQIGDDVGAYGIRPDRQDKMAEVKGASLAPLPKTLADAWILARLAEVTASVTAKIEKYEFSSAGEELRDFTWSDLADWYLEIAKIEKGKEEILVHVLQTILKLWHPFTPFVTEHIWSLAGFPGQLIVAEWPMERTISGNNGADFERLRVLITDLRRLRNDQGIDAKARVAFALWGPEAEMELVKQNAHYSELARASELSFESPKESENHLWRFAVSGALTIGVFFSQTIDLVAERGKLDKEIAEVEKYLISLNVKLENKDFISNAPLHIVDEMKQKRADAEATCAALKERLVSL